MTDDTVLVKANSHRARGKLYRLVGEDVPCYGSMLRDTGQGVFRIPAAKAAEAKAITGISGFRDGDDLLLAWIRR